MTIKTIWKNAYLPF